MHGPRIECYGLCVRNHQSRNPGGRDELQATVDARDKMYSVIAHDLRSPIGTLKMVFNMLLMNLTPEQIGEENLEMVTMGNNITESTFMLLDNLLKWTKSQIGRMSQIDF